MSRLFGAAVLALCLGWAGAASAHQRLGDGAMGALAGALVAGPVGAVAGGAVGYIEGPHIAHHIFHHGRRRVWRRRHYDRRLHRWVWR